MRIFCKLSTRHFVCSSSPLSGSLDKFTDSKVWVKWKNYKSQVHSFDQVKAAPPDSFIRAQSPQNVVAAKTGWLLVQSMLALYCFIHLLIIPIAQWLKLLLWQLNVNKHNGYLWTRPLALLGNSPVEYFAEVVDSSTGFQHLIKQWVLIQVGCVLGRINPHWYVGVSVRMEDGVRRNQHKLN